MKFVRALLKPWASRDASRIPATLQDAIAYHEAGRLDEAKRIYEDILAASPDSSECLHLLGVMASQTGDHERAVTLIARAIELDPGNSAFRFNLGLTLKALKRHEEAALSFGRAIAIAPDSAEAHSSLGLALQELRQLEAAMESYDRAIALKPTLAEAHYNRANALQEMKRLEDAVQGYLRALELRPDLAQAWCNLGFALRGLRAWTAAADAFDRAADLDPRLDFLEGTRILTKMEVCDWAHLENDIRELEAKIRGGERVAAPFSMLALTDSAALQRRTAEIYARARYPCSGVLGPIIARPKDEKVRLGYFSADFHQHPVAQLTAELFETHDRLRFEVIGVSLGVDTGDAMRRRLTAAFDRFVDLRSGTDAELAAKSRELGIDIAIDLGGHTQDGRPGIFAHRAAPVQVSYAGYLGTMGADYYDYLLADPVLIPEEARADYVEKIVYLPSYQANDSQRRIGDRRFTRADLALPESGFVFCCFNNNYKIMPATFACWMRILDRTPGSVLLLYAPNETAASNLASEAARLGLDPARIIFARRLPRHDYLSRFRNVDLFLDTFPYNAGTVASDALWAGLPVLTLMGGSFASRIGASLLHAVGLPELVTRTRDAYESLAVELATCPEMLADLRARLEQNRDTAPLFDTLRFTRRLEEAYTTMHDRWRAGQPPEHITIG